MKTCLVCGNGPSLADVRNDTLDKFDTFGGNWIFEKYVPTYYVFVDPMIGAANRNWTKSITELPCAKYVHEDLIEDIPDATPLKVIHRPGFSYDPLAYVYGYFSVTTVMLQLAFMLGYERVGLVGMDHRYNTPNGRREWHSVEQDTNHFTDKYYRDRLPYWKAPRLDLLAKWMDFARKEYEKAGRRIVNLTPGSALTVFPFDRLEDWID